MLETANLRNRFGGVDGMRESAPRVCGEDGGDGRGGREQRSAQGWQQGAGGVRFVESSKAFLVIRNFAYCNSSHFCLVESRGAGSKPSERFRSTRSSLRVFVGA